MESVRTEKEAVTSKTEPSRLSFPREFPYEFESSLFSSALSSPGDSTETDESSDDEEDFLAGLTRRLALSTPRLAVPSFTREKAEGKSRAVASSPQSTLSGLGSWSASGNGSPNGPSSQVPSPPTTPFTHKDETLDLISAAAGQVARLKMNNEANTRNSNQTFKFLQQPTRAPDTLQYAENFSNATAFHLSPSLPQSYMNTNQLVRQSQVVKQQCAAIWGRQMKNSYMEAENPNQIRQQEYFQIQRRSCGLVGNENGRYLRSMGLCNSSCPPPQKQQPPKPLNPPAVAMRDRFLSGSGAKRQCAGTGVFLPRRYGNPAEPRKKLGCSPVLVPAKVVHALNLNMGDFNDQSLQHLNPGFSSDYYDAAMARRNALLAQQRRGPRSVHGVDLNSEMSLAQEWSY